MTPLPITSFTLCTALGCGIEPTLAALAAQRTGLAPTQFLDAALPTWIGVVPGVDAMRLPAGLEEFDCRNNRLAWLGLQQDGLRGAVQNAKARFGAARIAVLLGTSTSGLLQTELAYRRRGAERRAACGLSLREHAQHEFGGGVRQPRAATRRPELGDINRVFVEREGVCERGAPHRCRTRRRGARRRRRQPVPDDDLRLQFARTAVARHLPSLGRAAPWPVARRGRGVRAARARDADDSNDRPRRQVGCSARAKATTAIT